MDTARLKKFAQETRRSLLEQVGSKLKIVRAEDSAARRTTPKAVAELDKQIGLKGEEQVIDAVAYTWFNRFCALRFMDVNSYTPIGVVSPASEQTQPEILAEAKMGHIDESLVTGVARSQVAGLFSGEIASENVEADVYRTLLVAVCNEYHKAMPYLFEKIDDYTEVLLPDDLLSSASTLALTREALTEEACADVEVLGWLYQFYISEKKDEVFAGLKKNKKVTPENIPAATQLFTPNWIVRYLVENSLGRLWMLNRPDSKLIEQMEYYVRESGAGVPPANPTATSTNFQSFTPTDALATSRRRLPHWQQQGATYFVTFRLADSLPQEKITSWTSERAEWLAAHPEPWSTEDQAEYSRLFPERRQQWLDNGFGACLLGRPEVAEIVSGALRHFDGERYLLDEFVVMPNHVHVLLKPLPDFDLSGILHSWKSFTAKKINALNGCSGTLWQDESFDHIVRSEAHLEFYRSYIRENPSKARLSHIRSECGLGITSCPGEDYAGGTPAPLSFSLKGESGAGVPPANQLSCSSKEESGAGVPPANQPAKQPAKQPYLRIEKPEDLKLIDPACGSGHMLVYAFDLLYAIYEEEGYDDREIPEKILTHNLFGIEIDPRAGELAAFALTMKAREKYRRFLRKPVQPNVCVLENVKFEETELKSYFDFVGRDLFTAPLEETLHQFEEADNFGSLIRPRVSDVAGVRKLLLEKRVEGELYLSATHRKVLRVLDQAEILGQRYHVVVANPPYMGGKGMNGRLGSWVKDHYPNSKSDLFAVFMERSLGLALLGGYSAMITMQSWMFLSSFEKLRTKLLSENTLVGMAHLGARAFDSIGGEVVSTTSFIFQRSDLHDFKGDFFRLIDGNSEAEKASSLREAIKNPNCGWFFRASADDFKKIPGSPVAYWVSERVLTLIGESRKLGDIAEARMGLATGNNAKYVRLWWEVSLKNIGFGLRSRAQALKSGLKWFPYSKGGPYRKWFGNNEYLVDWYNDGHELQNTKDPSGKRIWAHNFNLDHIFESSITWSDVTSGHLSVRYNDSGFLFDGSGTCAFFESTDEKLTALGFLNTVFANAFSKVLNPTLHFQTGDFRSMPFPECLVQKELIDDVEYLVALSEEDWNLCETSWGFSRFCILEFANKSALGARYGEQRDSWGMRQIEVHQREEKINRIVIDGCKLGSEVSTEVPLHEITLTCNPHYRYDHTKPEAELEALLLADTMREFISYAVGCMLGRYSLDKPGLILANQGETIEDYHKQIPSPTFEPDPDNVLPILDGDWFIDDITDRFRTFLKVTFGDEHFEENLKFIEDAIGKDIRNFFIKDFYNDHIKRYKKRPIYWLFSSPKGSFQALIYMHRYRPDTVSIVLNNYLREFRTKLAARVENLQQLERSSQSSKTQKSKAFKELANLRKMIDELDEYERDILYPLATQQIEIDLDDGVKVNYPKFGKALKEVSGLEAA